MVSKKEVPLNARIPRSLEKYLFTYETLHGLKNNRSRAIRRLLTSALQNMMTREDVQNMILELDNNLNEIKLKQENEEKKIREECEYKINKIRRERESQRNEISMRITDLKFCLENEEVYIPKSEPSLAEKILNYPYFWRRRHNRVWLDAPAGQAAFDSLNISKTEFWQKVRELETDVKDGKIELVADGEGRFYTIKHLQEKEEKGEVE